MLLPRRAVAGHRAASPASQAQGSLAGLQGRAAAVRHGKTTHAGASAIQTGHDLRGRSVRKRITSKSPVRSCRTPGSVRGRSGNWPSYRDGPAGGRHTAKTGRHNTPPHDRDRPPPRWSTTDDPDRPRQTTRMVQDRLPRQVKTTDPRRCRPRPPRLARRHHVRTRVVRPGPARVGGAGPGRVVVGGLTNACKRRATAYACGQVWVCTVWPAPEAQR